eukprot:TRINITY_DN4002_c0_g1_i2.p2 TRINITY_DN4002_c0_g1~~TRINITY_DN4002_c0_g1_i2.p2  ORF type:complete len:530 (+),score=106.20 TRINITY_DN4002_c0_g1_i2:48-1637(+)
MSLGSVSRNKILRMRRISIGFSKYFISGLLSSIALNVLLDLRASRGKGSLSLRDSFFDQPQLEKLREENLQSVPTSGRLLKSSGTHRPKRLSEEILFSGVICIHENHFTPFLNRTLQDFAIQIRPLFHINDQNDEQACHLTLVLLQRTYAAIKNIQRALLSNSFHSIQVLEEDSSFLLFKSEYGRALTLEPHVFRPQSSSDFRDYDTLTEWYRDLNTRRPVIRGPRYETSLLPWTYFNQTHLFSAETDIVTSKIMGSALKAHIRELLVTEGEDPSRPVQRGWYQFIPEWGINLVLLLEGDRIIRGFKEKTEDPVMIPMPFVTESQTIHWISPLFKRDKWKLSTLSSLRANARHNVHRHLITELQTVPNERFTAYPMMEEDPKNISMLDFISKILPNITRNDPGALVFYSAVPLLSPTRNFLNRIRLNVLQGHQVFSPIPHVRYKLPSPSNGFFDSVNWAFVGFYAVDYPLMAASVSRRSNEGIHLLRVPEPDLSLSQGIPGVTDEIQHLGERSALEKYILDYIQKHTLK